MDYHLSLPHVMTIRGFLDRVQEAQAADLTAPPRDAPQEAFARWVHTFTIPESELMSVVLWVKAPHWAYPVGFFVCAVESPAALQLRDEDALPQDVYLRQGEVYEELTPQDLQLAEAAVCEFVTAMQEL